MVNAILEAEMRSKGDRMTEEEFNRKYCQEQGIFSKKYLERVVKSYAYGAGRLLLAEGTTYIKAWGILKRSFWDHLRSEVY